METIHAVISVLKNKTEEIETMEGGGCFSCRSGMFCE